MAALARNHHRSDHPGHRADQKDDAERIVADQFERSCFMKPDRFWIVAASGLSFVVGLAQAAPVPPIRYEPEVANCISQAAHGNEWLEKTLWALRDQEAGWVGAEVVNTNGTHDLGVLQVNSAWVPRISQLVGRSAVQVRSWLVHDPCFNVAAARWIFLSALGQTRDYWKAIGVYHSPTASRQGFYATGVAAHLRRRYGEGVFN